MLSSSFASRLYPRDVTSLLGISERTLARWVSIGKFPKPVQYGRLRHWPADAVEMWMESAKNGGSK